MSNPKAQAAKEKGNQAFKAADYPSAIGHYTSAILADKTDPTFYLNRAAAYLKLGKYEDAERDCTTVLGLSKNNVKALFRRGQARVGLDNLLEAEKDFSEVLRIEPSNTAVQDELKTVTSLIRKEKAKKAKSPLQSSFAPETTAGRRRRVPIKIIDASGRPVPSSAPAPASSAPSAAASKKASAPTPEPEPMEVDTQPPTAHPPHPRPTQAQAQPPKSKISPPDTLEAVSTRSLRSPSPAPVPAAPTPTTLKPTPAPAPSPPPQPPKPASSFKEAKEARDSTKQSRVGGGIFRRNGESTIFPPRGDAGPASPATTPASTNAAAGAGGEAMDVNGDTVASAPVVNVATSSFSASLTLNGGKSPTTLFEFSRLWESLKSPGERWALINTIPPTQFPTLCKTSLEPTLLVSILSVFLSILKSLSSSSSASTEPEHEQVKRRINEYLDNFSRIPRFSTLLLFLSRKEKEVVRDVWTLLGVHIVEGVWKAGVA